MSKVFCQFSTANDLDIEDCFLSDTDLRVGKVLDIEIGLDDQPMQVIGISNETTLSGDPYCLVTLTDA
jgi:putative alpha-1,2-mannosidase